MSDFVNKITEAFSTYADSPCVTDHEGARTLTYAEVGAIAGRIQAKLRALGVKPGDAVVVDLDRIAEYTASDVAIFMLGAVLVPLIPEYPPERVDYIMADCDAKVLIGPDFLLDLDSFEPDLSVTTLGPDDRRLIIYTSGSTGRPKGVVFKNLALSQTYDPTSHALDIPDRHACVSPMSFVASVTELIIRMIRGKHLHLISDRMRKDVLALKDYITTHEIGSVFLVPSALRVFDLADTSLTRVYTGGERVANFVPAAYTLINTYGQTETLGAVLNFAIDKAYENTPIGVPKRGATVRLEDEDGNVVEGEGEGELVATGWFASEYLNRPEETAKTFTTLPDGRTEVRMGDIVRRLADGTYLYVNRRDWMVKVNGQRVDMGEVETVMAQVPGVEEAAVRNFANAQGQTYLCGYYVGATLSEEDVRTVLTDKLAAYMVPEVIVQINAMPRTANGKVDRMALPEPSALGDEGPYVGPETPLEEKVAELVEGLFNKDNVSVTFDLRKFGLTSLSAVSMLTDLEAASGKRIPLAVFGYNHTIKDIAAAIEDCRVKTVEFEKQPPKAAYPLLPNVQLPLYQIYGADPDNFMMQMPLVLAISGGHTADEVKRCATTIVDNHPILKSTIEDVDGVPCFVPHTDDVAVVERRSMDHVPTKEELMAMVGRIPARGHRLYELTVLDDPEGTVYVVFNIHHFVTDGFSNGVIKGEFDTLLAGGSIEPEEFTAFDLVDYQYYVKDDPSFEEMDAWFAETLADFEYPCYPLSTSVRENNPNMAAVTVDARAVESFCDRHEIPLADFYIIVYARTLEEAMGCRVPVSYVYSRRDDPRYRNTVAFMAYTCWALLPPAKDDVIADIDTAERYLTELNARLDYPEFRLVERTTDKPALIDYDFLLNVKGASGSADVKNIGDTLVASMRYPFVAFMVSRDPTDANRHMLLVTYGEAFYDYADMLELADRIRVLVEDVVARS